MWVDLREIKKDTMKVEKKEHLMAARKVEKRAIGRAVLMVGKMVEMKVELMGEKKVDL